MCLSVSFALTPIAHQKYIYKTVILGKPFFLLQRAKGREGAARASCVQLIRELTNSSDCPCQIIVAHRVIEEGQLLPDLLIN